MLTALASLMTSGYLDPSQYAKLDEEYGLPPRSTQSIANEVQQKQLGLEGAKAAAETAKNPPDPTANPLDANAEGNAKPVVKKV